MFICLVCTAGKVVGEGDSAGLGATGYFWGERKKIDESLMLVFNCFFSLTVVPHVRWHLPPDYSQLELLQRRLLLLLLVPLPAVLEVNVGEPDNGFPNK